MICRFLVVMLLFVTFSQAQDSISTQIETPKIAVKLMLGDEIISGDIKINFVDVEIDSRCPINVNCVRAGEAKVVFEVFKSNKFIKRDVIEITPSSYLSNILPQLYVSDSLTIFAYNLKPYPEYGYKIKKKDYYLQVLINN